MYVNAKDMKEFYFDERGAIVQRIIRNKIRKIWPDISNQTLIGIGYTSPFLIPFTKDTDNCFSLMPYDMGSVDYPLNGDSKTALIMEEELPFKNSSINKALLVHFLETTYKINEELREIWRVLDDEGKILIIVPNRTGLWSRIDNTAFGNGRPFSFKQISKILQNAMFDVTHHETALFTPPTKSKFIISMKPFWESLEKIFPNFGGVHIIEAKKSLYRPALIGKTVKVNKIKSAIALSED